MLLNSFYTLIRQQSEGNKVSATVSFNKDHQIFAGHFPGHPVVPGVCMMQILREVMEVEVGGRLRIASGENMKFLSIINPNENPEVDVVISFTEADGQYNLTASLQSDQTIFFKFKGTLKKV